MPLQRKFAKLLEILKTFQTILNIFEKKKQGFPVKKNKM